MVTKEVWKALEELHKMLGEFIDLVELEYTDDDEYVCHNEDQVDEEWCDVEVLEDIMNSFTDIGMFLGK